MSGEPNTDNNSEKVEDKTAESVIDLSSDEAKAAISKQVEETIGARLAREKAKIEAAEAKATAATERAAAAESTISTLNEKIESLQGERDTAAKDALILKLAIEEDVKPELIRTLKGDTPEELKTAIQTVKGSVKAPANRIFDGKDASTPKDGTASLNAIVLKAAARTR